MDLQWNAREIEPELKRLSSLATLLEPGLADRLEEIRRWIKDKKPGLLTSKKYVIDFLYELILDTHTWLGLQTLTELEKEEVFKQMSSVERFWYEFLFPKWFNECDPKLPIWKQKMMSGDFSKSDEPLLNLIVYQIQRDGADVLRRYIVDLSMATDLVVSSSSETPLCVQLTILANEYLTSKKQHWEATLRYWGIERSLFLNFNPSHPIATIPRLANEIIWQSDNLPPSCYNQSSLDAGNQHE
jgi:hypothetical protein